MKHIYLSVVIPAYNEETNIRLGALDKVVRYLGSQHYSWEVLIVNDGSTDETASLIREFVKINRNFRLIEMPHRGKAATVITGLEEALGEIVLFSDLDQATPLCEVEKLLPLFNQGYDVVIGSRNSQRKGAPLSRRIMARGFMMLRSFILGLGGIRDTQCGFKAFRSSIVKSITKHLTLYVSQSILSGSNVTAGFDVELLYLINRNGYKIREVPVEWHYVETRRVSPIRDSWQGLMDILRIKINELKGRYT